MQYKRLAKVWPKAVVDVQVGSFIFNCFFFLRLLPNLTPSLTSANQFLLFGFKSNNLGRVFCCLISIKTPRFNYKDILPSNTRSSLDNLYCCVRCATEYVGSTTQVHHTTVREHFGKSYGTGFPLFSPQYSDVNYETLVTWNLDTNLN